MTNVAPGVAYRAQACGDAMPDGKWQGWIEFLPLDGTEPIRSGRETTQPNRTDTEYWATGLSTVAAFLVSQKAIPARRAVDFLCVLPAAVPGVFLGIDLLVQRGETRGFLSGPGRATSLYVFDLRLVCLRHAQRVLLHVLPGSQLRRAGMCSRLICDKQ